MPLIAYFSCTGAVLIAFLFLSNAYIAPPQDKLRQIESAFSIRIKSSAPKPDLIVFDTSAPAVVPERRAQLDLMPVAPVVANAFGNLREPIPVRKKAPRKRIVKTMIADVARLNSPEVSGLNYPTSW